MNDFLDLIFFLKNKGMFYTRYVFEHVKAFTHNLW